MNDKVTPKDSVPSIVKEGEKVGPNKSVTNLQRITSLPQFKEIQELLAANQSLVKRVNPNKDWANAGYTTVEQILNKKSGSSTRTQ